jgi:hypothetical protein
MSAGADFELYQRLIAGVGGAFAVYVMSGDGAVVDGD